MSLRHRAQAEEPEKYDRMVKVFDHADTKDELERMAMLYIMDMSFPRGDIALAVKATESERGWC